MVGTGLVVTGGVRIGLEWHGRLGTACRRQGRAGAVRIGLEWHGEAGGVGPGEGRWGGAGHGPVRKAMVRNGRRGEYWNGMDGC